MSDRKSLDAKSEASRQMNILQNRRMDKVRKNFAIGVQGIVAAKNLNRGARINTRKN